VKSTVDDRIYTVQSLPDKQDAADLLANMRKKLETLVTHLQKMYADDPRTGRLLGKFNPDRISEGTNHGEHTSYSLNKGEKIVFCLRSKDEKNKLVDLNTMMFVALHELGHICTESIGHTDEFWDNFRWLLAESINIGVYKEQDFKSKPVPYCGIKITESPLH
jgi:predicted metal-dependent hydrolase